MEFTDESDGGVSNTGQAMAANDAWAAEDHVDGPKPTMTNKIPPTFDGRSSWFAYEEKLDDWLDITTVDPEKQGPSLKNRLIGDAAHYK